MYIQPEPRVGTAIGDKAVDLSEIAKAGLLDGVEGLNDPVKIFSEVQYQITK